MNYPNSKVSKEINNNCRVLTGQGKGCGDCKMMALCLQDIKDYREWKLKQDG